jgi:hypothetical protein
MSLTIPKNKSAPYYVEIIKDIERGCATFEQWDQLSANMVFALPWRLLQQCPDGLAAAEPELEQDSVKTEDVLSEKSDKDHGMQWDEELGTQPPDPTDTVEEEVMAYIATLHTCQKPYPHVCPVFLRQAPKWMSRRRHNRDRIEAFRSLKEFTGSQFGNGTSILRNEFSIDEINDDAITNCGSVKLDSSRLARLWHERFNIRDMSGFELLEGKPGQITVCGPIVSVEKEY